jgi:hypothetical protein
MKSRRFLEAAAEHFDASDVRKVGRKSNTGASRVVSAAIQRVI